jgi:hypothetical protein
MVTVGSMTQSASSSSRIVTTDKPPAQTVSLPEYRIHEPNRVVIVHL